MRAMIATTLLSASALCLAASPVDAQPYSPFSDFQSLSTSELATLQVKITYLGSVTYPVPTLAFTSSAGSIDLTLFAPYRRLGWQEQYGMDDFAVVSFRVSSELLQAMIDSVSTLPAVADGGADSSGYVSFALLKTAGGTKVFESIVDEANGCALMKEIEGALAPDTSAVRLARERACDMGMTYNDPPTEVTSGVNVHVAGFRRIQSTDEYVAIVRVTNTSPTELPSPLTLLPRVRGEAVELLGETAFTCRIGRGGEPYIDLPVGTGGLAPDGFVEIVVRVRNPDNERFDMSPAVFAGPGTR